MNFRFRGYGTTALISAARGGHLASVEALLAAKAEVNIRGHHTGRTALTAAAENGHCEIVARLVAAKADVRSRALLVTFSDSDRRLTALEFAERGGHQACVETLRAATPKTRRGWW